MDPLTGKALGSVGKAVAGPAGRALKKQIAPTELDVLFQLASERLARDGFRLIADLQRAEERDLMRRYGEEGSRLWRLARGIDARKVEPDHETKSISAETTFNSDISDFRPLEQQLWELTERVSDRLKAKALAGSTVTLKLKTADFKLRTRARDGMFLVPCGLSVQAPDASNSSP